jgi:predicted ATP-binding protein involved in virulence
MAKSKKPDKDGKPGGAQGAYFLSLTLENVRCFGEKQTLDLSDGQGRPAPWTILLGNNGTGKTTVLQALVMFSPDEDVGRGGVAEELEEGIRRHQLVDKWLASLPERIFFRGDGSHSPKVTVQVAQGGSLQPASKRHTSPSLEIVLWERAVGLKDQPGYTTPRCYAYGAGRRLGVSSLRERESDTGTETLFSDLADMRDAEEWLLRLDYSAIKESAIQKRQQERLEQVRRLLIQILPEVGDIRFTTPTGPRPNPRVEFQTPYGWVPLRQLGYGYQTLIAWMVDFASRMVERYPESPDPLAEPAVVLVDEIDLHLHPKWQRTVVQLLSEHFPNTQFIATAHSPLIVQSAAGANLAVLRREGDHVVIDNDVDVIRNWRIDQIYTSDLFGLESARPPQIDEALAKRREILSKSHITDDDKRQLKEIEQKIGELPGGETAQEANTLRLIQESLQALEQGKGRRP